MYDFYGNKFLITGATSGMGLAATRMILSSGGEVIATGRKFEKIYDLQERYPDRLTVINSDAGTIEAGTDLVDVVKSSGGIDGVWLNAGVAVLASCQEITPEDFEYIMNINVRGPMLQLAAISSYIKDKGSVLISTSSSVYEGAPMTSLYSASKGALEASSKVWASELANRRIRVNTLVPGPIETNFRRFLSNDDQKRFEDAVVEQVPLGRCGSDEEAANVAVFMLSELSAYITGSQIPVDGGLIMR